MPIVRYGEWGRALLLFPTAQADFLDNERFGETGMQKTPTASGVDLSAIATACGIRPVAGSSSACSEGRFITTSTRPSACSLAIPREIVSLLVLDSMINCMK